jgi:hypothetical protein
LDGRGRGFEPALEIAPADLTALVLIRECEPILFLSITLTIMFAEVQLIRIFPMSLGFFDLNLLEDVLIVIFEQEVIFSELVKLIIKLKLIILLNVLNPGLDATDPLGWRLLCH